MLTVTCVMESWVFSVSINRSRSATVAFWVIDWTSADMADRCSADSSGSGVGIVGDRERRRPCERLRWRLDLALVGSGESDSRNDPLGGVCGSSEFGRSSWAEDALCRAEADSERPDERGVEWERGGGFD